MKKLLALLLAFAMVFSLAACGGDEEVEDTADDAVVEEEVVEEEVVEEDAEEEVVEEEVVEEEVSEVDYSAYESLRPILVQNFVGVNANNEEEFMALSFNEDGTFAILAVSTSTDHASFVGPVTNHGDNTYTIVDEASELQITFTASDNGDGTWTLDVGDAGSMLITSEGITADDIMYILAVIEQNTAAVN